MKAHVSSFLEQEASAKFAQLEAVKEQM